MFDTTSTPRRFVRRMISAATSFVMVNDFVWPHTRALQFIIRARRRREHARAVQERDLDRRLPDAAARREHQDVFAPLQLARVISMCQAVRNVSGNAAACTKSISSGIEIRFCTGTLTYSA